MFQNFSMVVKLEDIREWNSSTAAAGGENLIHPNLPISAVSEIKAYKNGLIFLIWNIRTRANQDTI